MIDPTSGPTYTPLTPLPDAPSLRSLRPPEADGLTDDTLEEINRLWTVVRAFSNAAHDVNNALQVVAGSAELLEARDLDPAVRRRVEIIRAESAKAAEIINRLLSYARAPRQPAQRLDIWPLVDAAVGMRMASAGRNLIALSVERQDSASIWIAVEGSKALQAILDLLLIAEDRVAGRQRARLVVRVIAEGAVVGVQIASESDEVEREALDDTAGLQGLMNAAQLWAASRIAAAQGGRVAVEGRTLTLYLPAAAAATPRSRR